MPLLAPVSEEEIEDNTASTTDSVTTALLSGQGRAPPQQQLPGGHQLPQQPPHTPHLKGVQFTHHAPPPQQTMLQHQQSMKMGAPGPEYTEAWQGHVPPPQQQHQQQFILGMSTDGSPDKKKELWASGCALILTSLSFFLILIFLPFSLMFATKVCQEYERAVVFRLGCLLTGREVGPGLFWVIPCIDSYTKLDLRVVSFSVPPQEILSKDSVTVSVDAVVFFRISDPVVSITNVNDASYSTKLLAQTTLRNTLGTMDLGEMLSKRGIIDNMS